MAAQALAKSFVGSTRSFQARGNVRASRAAVKVAAADRPLWLPGDGGGQGQQAVGTSGPISSSHPRHPKTSAGTAWSRVHKGSARSGLGAAARLWELLLSAHWAPPAAAAAGITAPPHLKGEMAGDNG